jgi:hypothetical protein
VTDEEWEKQRARAILAAFQTGRPVFADSEGEMRYVDGNGERLPDEVGVPQAPIPKATMEVARRAARASYLTYIASVVAAIGNAYAGLWHPWQFAIAVVFVFNAFLWRRINQRQRAMLGKR